jgi:nucleoside-diphosphate-sugar epimerase
LLTGVTGFLGSEVFCRLARTAGLGRLVCLVRKVPKAGSIFHRRLVEHGLEAEFSRIRFVETDFSSTEGLADALDRATKLLMTGQKFVVVHMAAIIHAKGAEEKREQHRLNIEVTDELLEWSAQLASHFVYISSVVAFGATLCKSKLRDEDDFVNFPWVSKFFSYYTSKRESHLRVSRQAQIPVTLVCPGIIHGSLELEKSSRKHLQYLREGKLKLAPSGSANFVGLDRTAQSVVHAALLVPEGRLQTLLVIDENLRFVDYFNLYVRLARGAQAQRVRRLPKVLGLVAIALHIVLAKFGVHVGILETLSQGSLHLNFESKHKLAPTEGLEANLKHSLP